MQGPEKQDASRNCEEGLQLGERGGLCERQLAIPGGRRHGGLEAHAGRVDLTPSARREMILTELYLTAVRCGEGDGRKHLFHLRNKRCTPAHASSFAHDTVCFILECMLGHRKLAGAWPWYWSRTDSWHSGETGETYFWRHPFFLWYTFPSWLETSFRYSGTHHVPLHQNCHQLLPLKRRTRFH